MPFSSESEEGYGSTTEAFIFSLRNKEAIGPFKSKVKINKNDKAINNKPDYGPVFGNGDIAIRSKANSNEESYTDFGKTYNVPEDVTHRNEILAGTHRFTPDEWEVFYLA